MAISRRNFLQAGAVAAVVAGTPLSKTVFASSNMNRNWVSSNGIPLMSKSIFTSVLNTSFDILPDRRQKERVQLVKVQDLAPSGNEAGKNGDECFSLTFRSASHPRLKQQTYRIRHDSLGEFDLFLGPVKSETYGMIYEAIINQIVS